ncbi:MAG: prolipoprotein diacylglyceryl transferase [Erysipelotrichales bacterium]|nr:prolipoprotein diacylglyceryl transferase [Erysipelotrichales bacterium]
MYNDLFTIGPFTVHGYGLMMAIGVLSAIFMTEYNAKKKGIYTEQIFDMAVWAILGGLVISKINYWVTIIPDIIKDPSILLHVMDGWVLYGGVLGGILAAWLYCRKKGMPFAKLADCAVPGVALAQGFGRIGCFLAGCCYGIPHEGFPHIIFTHSDYAPNNVALFPSQLVSSGLDFLHFAILMTVLKKSKKDGTVILTYLMCYSIGRFLIEFVRGDLERGSVGILSTSQFISVFVFLAALGTILYRKFKKAKTEPEK